MYINLILIKLNLLKRFNNKSMTLNTAILHHKCDFYKYFSEKENSLSHKYRLLDKIRRNEIKPLQTNKKPLYHCVHSCQYLISK